MDIHLTYDIPNGKERFAFFSPLVSRISLFPKLGEWVCGRLNRRMVRIALQLQGIENVMHSADFEITEMPKRVSKLQRWLNRLNNLLQPMKHHSPNFDALRESTSVATASLGRIVVFLERAIEINKMDTTEFLSRDKVLMERIKQSPPQNTITITGKPLITPKSPLSIPRRKQAILKNE